MGKTTKSILVQLAEQADINQLKTKLQKTINGQPVIVYTYKN